MTHYRDLLEHASNQMVKYTTSSRFMRWVVKYLYLNVRPRHASIALFDEGSLCFDIRFSDGPQRIPSRLISLGTDSPLIKWFLTGNQETAALRKSKKLILTEDLKPSKSNEAMSILHEFELYRVSVCVKIETSNRLAGYLLLGPKESGENYTLDDLSLLQILANDIAVEIEKEEYLGVSLTDPLTGLLNRNALSQKLKHFYMKCQNEEEEFGVAMIDIDHFKQINDTYGHPAGDQILKAAAGIIKSNIRPGDLAFRFGGEEFLILLTPDARDPQKLITSGQFRKDMEGVMDRIRAKFLERPIHCLQYQIPLTVSIGLSFLHSENWRNDFFIQEADQALYFSKRNGRNQMAVYGKLTIPEGIED